MLIGGRFVSAACGLVQVPFAMAYLGTEAFGLWAALSGFLWTLGILDGGLGFALQNRLARLLATRREAEAAALARRGKHWLWVAAIGVLAMGIPLAYVLPWADWLGVHDPTLRAQTPLAIATMVGIAALLLPLAISARIAAARQETWLTGLWSALGSGASLIVLVACVQLSLPLAALVAAAGALPLVLYLGLALHLSARKSAVAQPAGIVAVDMKGIAMESVLFFVPQASAALVSSFVPMLIALFAGSAAVAPYSVLQRLFGLLLQINTLGLQPTWPAYTHAAARGDSTTARRLFRLSMLVTLGGSGSVTLLLAVLARPIVGVWLGGHAPSLDAPLIWSVAGWHAVQCIGQPPAMLLNGLGRNAALAAFGWINLVASLLLSLWLSPLWGAVGVIAALAIPYVGLNLPVVFWESRRALAAITRLTPPA